MISLVHTDRAVARGSRQGCGRVGAVKGPFDVCRRLNAPPAAPATFIISNFPVIYYLYRYLFVQFHGPMPFAPPADVPETLIMKLLSAF